MGLDCYRSVMPYIYLKPKTLEYYHMTPTFLYGASRTKCFGFHNSVFDQQKNVMKFYQPLLAIIRTKIKSFEASDLFPIS